jgi:hypothetical protein
VSTHTLPPCKSKGWPRLASMGRWLATAGASLRLLPRYWPAASLKPRAGPQSAGVSEHNQSTTEGRHVGAASHHHADTGAIEVHHGGVELLLEVERMGDHTDRPWWRRWWRNGVCQVSERRLCA